MASPHPAKARQQVAELGQLHLGLALPRAGVQGEDVQDQRGPVDHLHLEPLLQVPELAGRELLIQDHRVRAGGVDQVVDLSHLALADEGGRIGHPSALHDAPHGVRTCRGGQRRQLFERRSVRVPTQADQDRPLDLSRPPGGGEWRLGSVAIRHAGSCSISRTDDRGRSAPMEVYDAAGTQDSAPRGEAAHARDAGHEVPGSAPSPGIGRPASLARSSFPGVRTAKPAAGELPGGAEPDRRRPRDRLTASVSGSVPWPARGGRPKP